MRSAANSVDDYLAELPAERRAVLARARGVILANLPDGIEEAMNWGMISYEVPLAVYPDTYNGQPLIYAALASRKNYMTVHLTSIYLDQDGSEAFEREYRATGKRYDLGKSCVRTRQVDDLPLDVIGRAVRSTTIEEFVSRVRAIRPGE